MGFMRPNPAFANDKRVRARLVELERMPKHALVAMWRTHNRHTWTAHPVHTWRKGEIARQIAEAEFTDVPAWLPVEVQ